MNNHDILEYLQSHAFFDGLSEEYLESLADCATTKSYQPGDSIFKQDTEASFFYIVFKGQIEVEIPAIYGPPVKLDSIREGQILGWSWLIPPYKWHFDAETQADSILVCIDGRCVRTKCEEDHSFGYELFKRFSQMMGERLQAARVHVLRQDGF